MRTVWRSARGGLLRDAGVYGIGNTAAALVPLALLPVLTRNVTPADYGLYANVVALANLLLPLASLGVSNVLARDYVHRQKLDYPAVVTTCTLISVVCMGILAFGFFAALALIPDLLAAALGKITVPLAIAALLILASQALQPTALAICQMQGRVFLYTFIRVGQMAIFAVAAIAWVVFLGGGGESLVFAKTIADTLILVLCVAWLVNSGFLVRRLDVNEGRRCLKYVLPLVPHMVAVAAIGAVDRLTVTYIYGPDEAGIYSVGHQIGMIMWLVVNSTNQAWQPWFYGQMQADNDFSRRRIVRATGVVVAGWLLIAAVFWLLAPVGVGLIAGGTFTGSAGVTRWIVIGFFFQGLYSLANSYLYYSGRTGRLALATLATAVVHVVMTYVLTIQGGVNGTAQAVALTYCVSFVLVAIAAQSTSRMPWLSALRRRDIPS
jgi:O-antigen/teichoic acid export membrane protein